MTTPISPPSLSHNQEMVDYYDAFRQFLSVDNASDEVRKRRLQVNRAQQKLLRLSQSQFYELATDVYDELQRRIRLGSDDPGFLSPNERLHPKRNQARKKLSLLSPTRFNDLAFDILFEIERRTPGVNRHSKDSAYGNGETQSPIDPEREHFERDQANVPPNFNNAPPIYRQQPNYHPDQHQNVRPPNNAPPQGLQHGYSQEMPQPPNFNNANLHQAHTAMAQEQETPNHPTSNGNHASSSTNSTYFSDMQSGNGHEGSDISSPRSPSQLGPGYDSHQKMEVTGPALNDAKRQIPPPLTIPESNNLFPPDSTSPLKSPSAAHMQTSVVTPTKSTLVEEDEGSELSDDAISDNGSAQPNYGQGWPQNSQPNARTNLNNQFYADENESSNNPTAHGNNHPFDDTEDFLSAPTNTLHISPPSRSISRNDTLPSTESDDFTQAERMIKVGMSPTPNDDYQTALNDKDEQIQLLVEEGTRMDENITKLEGQLAESEALKDTLVEENGRLHQMIGEIELAKDNALSELESSKLEFNTQTERYINELESKQRSLADLEIQHMELQEKHTKLLAANTEHESSLAQFNSQILMFQGTQKNHEEVSKHYSIDCIFSNIYFRQYPRYKGNSSKSDLRSRRRVR